MNFNQLEQSDKDLIIKYYQESGKTKEVIQNELADMYDVTPRTIRGWAKKLDVGVMNKNLVDANRIMVYDIETSRAEGKMWWTGKQYIGVHQITKFPKIISIAWKWLGEEEVHTLSWDENQSDEEMLRKFLPEYNKAHMIIGQNNNRFDNRWINARAAMYNLDVNIFVRSFDIMKQAKNKFRLLSYSMKHMCEFFGVEQKLQHEGIKMWDKIEDGTPEEQAEGLEAMLVYNRGDIVSTEALYMRLRKYFNHISHFGVLNGGEKFTCPDTGSYNVDLLRTTVTAAGTIQRIMVSKETGTSYKITNKQYMNFLDWKMKQAIKLN